jgi:hemerythrin-like metal-binding protein
MRLIAWKDEYNIGIAAIDDEHRQLVAAINRLHEELDGVDSRRTVISFFGELQKEIAAHFTHEESFMRERSYEELGRHKADHDRLLEQLDDIKEAYAFSDEVDSVGLGIRLEEWFFHHFRTYDAKLHQMLGEH